MKRWQEAILVSVTWDTSPRVRGWWEMTISNTYHLGHGMDHSTDKLESGWQSRSGAHDGVQIWRSRVGAVPWPWPWPWECSSCAQWPIFTPISRSITLQGSGYPNQCPEGDTCLQPDHHFYLMGTLENTLEDYTGLFIIHFTCVWGKFQIIVIPINAA